MERLQDFIDATKVIGSPTNAMGIWYLIPDSLRDEFTKVQTGGYSTNPTVSSVLNHLAINAPIENVIVMFACDYMLLRFDDIFVLKYRAYVKSVCRYYGIR